MNTRIIICRAAKSGKQMIHFQREEKNQTLPYKIKGQLQGSLEWGHEWPYCLVNLHTGTYPS